LFDKYGRKPRLILDLACGTGSLTSLLHKRGYDIIGLDSSAEMLAVAKDKEPNILYINQDMREFELYGTVDTVLCLCDGLNYILRKDELLKIFKLVKNYLNPGGLFIFDLNTRYKFEKILADNTFAAAEASAAYIWENRFGGTYNDYSVTFFAEDTDGSYGRFEEYHRQRVYSPETVTGTAAKAGFKILGAFDMDKPNGLKKPTDRTERVCYVLTPT
jgi:SAM-dependent methyltransferase